jgi:NADPH:quinone reductase-like Zn-dependent oxidoreductase
VSDIHAACLPTAYATAYRMLHTRGQVQPGERVLVLGASGGVGTCCIQLARRAGCEVIAVTSSAAKAARLAEIGAHHVIDTSVEDYVAWVVRRFGKPRIRGGGGVDVCVNFTGGETWAQCFRTVRRDGRILTCGATAGYAPPTDLRYTWSFEHRIIGSNGWTNADHLAMLGLIAAGEIVPVVDRVTGFEGAAQGIADLGARRVLGKVVLVP